MEENYDFLKDHAELIEHTGFWHPVFKSTIMKAIEARYSPNVTNNYQAVDFIVNGDEVLVKWQKRILPG